MNPGAAALAWESLVDDAAADNGELDFGYALDLDRAIAPLTLGRRDRQG